MNKRQLRYVFIGLIVVMSLVLAGAGSSRALAAVTYQDDGGEDGGDGASGTNPHCVPDGAQHPLGTRLADTYGVGYEQIMQWFCEEQYGFGQIAMALQTSQVTGQPPETLLAERSAGRGWGEIWKEQGLIGRSEDGGPPPWAGNGRPPWAGPKQERSGERPGNGNGNGNGNRNGNGNGNGNDQGGGNGNGNRPCWAGPGPLPDGCVKPTDEPEDDG